MLVKLSLFVLNGADYSVKFEIIVDERTEIAEVLCRSQLTWLWMILSFRKYLLNYMN